MIVVESENKKIIGSYARLDQIEDIGLRYRFEAFVTRQGWILYQDLNGEFGVCNPATHHVQDGKLPSWEEVNQAIEEGFQE